MKKVIIFEGIDGCGKTTVLNIMRKRLGDKCAVIYTPHMISNLREALKPSLSVRDEDEKGVLSNNLIYTLMKADKIASLLPGGILYNAIFDDTIEYILLDRFIMSFAVYQKTYGITRRIDQLIFTNLLKELEPYAYFENIYLKIDPEEASGKIDERGNERDVTESEVQTSISAEFDCLAEHVNSMFGNIHTINQYDEFKNRLKPEVIADQVEEILRSIECI